MCMWVMHVTCMSLAPLPGSGSVIHVMYGGQRTHVTFYGASVYPTRVSAEGMRWDEEERDEMCLGDSIIIRIQTVLYTSSFATTLLPHPSSDALINPLPLFFPPLPRNPLDPPSHPPLPRVSVVDHHFLAMAGRGVPRISLAAACGGCHHSAKPRPACEAKPWRGGKGGGG